MALLGAILSPSGHIFRLARPIRPIVSASIRLPLWLATSTGTLRDSVSARNVLWDLAAGSCPVTATPRGSRPGTTRRDRSRRGELLTALGRSTTLGWGIPKGRGGNEKWPLRSTRPPS